MQGNNDSYVLLMPPIFWKLANLSCSPEWLQERILRLSQPLLDLLQEWSARATASEEEKTLAGQLHADFSRWAWLDKSPVLRQDRSAITLSETVSCAPRACCMVHVACIACPALFPVSSSFGSQSVTFTSQACCRFPPAQAPVPQLGSTSDQTTLDDGEEEEGGVRVVADRTCVTHVEPSQQEGLRLAGNDAYRGGDLTLAIRCYSQALDVPVPGVCLGYSVNGCNCKSIVVILPPQTQ
jgi:hypothetical protein